MTDGKKVVLDLDEFKKGSYHFPAFLRELVKRDPWASSASQFGGPQRDLALWIADQIEAQTKPPRIPEPKGLGAIVEAASRTYPATRRKYLRQHSGGWSANVGWADWTDLLDPVLVREGING